MVYREHVVYSVHEKGCLTWAVRTPTEKSSQGQPDIPTPRALIGPLLVLSLFGRLVQGNHGLLAGQHQALLPGSPSSPHSTVQMRGDGIHLGQLQIPWGPISSGTTALAKPPGS